MSNFSNDEKIKLIKKYYKKYPIFLELSLINYENYNIYICINEISKNDSYRLSWFNLDEITDRNIKKYISCEYISASVIEMIKKDFLDNDINYNYHGEILKNDYIVKLNANIPTKECETINLSFRRYLPGTLSNYFDLLVFIFRNMPKKYEDFLFELLAGLTKTTERYEYKQEFDFDLFNDDINELFEYQICKRGEKYYQESRVKFLEKIDDRYFAIVEGTEKYLTIIKYKDEEKRMQVYCSCPCEFYCKHMYAVILAIRNNEFNRFYKIMYKNPDKSLLERVTNFDYLLCLGVVEQNFEIINNYGDIELVPILDVNDRYNWQILEDSEDEKLTKQVKYFLDNK
ncbi:MAG: SWIM zinc finger family protein [Bacilli bacterium]|nr:SWIM zinc finger family protein [Bacilli bacterium]